MKEWIEKIIALFKKHGLTDDKVAALQAELEKIEAPVKNDEKPIDTTKITDPAIKEIVEGLKTTVNALKEQNKALLDTIAEEKDAREKGIKAQEDLAKTEKEKKVKEAVDADIKAGKFPEAKRDDLMKIATADLAAYQIMTKDIPVDKHFADKKKDNDGDKGNHQPATPLERVSNSTLRDKIRSMAEEPTE